MPALRRVFVAASVLVAGFLVIGVHTAKAAEDGCVVNGTWAPAPLIEGTDDDDTIECKSGVPYGTTVDAKGGNDTFTMQGTLASQNWGTISLGDGNDSVTMWNYAPPNRGAGVINGDAGDDNITIAEVTPDGGTANEGTVDGGDGNDTITVTGKGTADHTADTNVGIVKGGDGDDTILVEGGVRTNGKGGQIDGGTGNDTITSTSPTFGNMGTIYGGSGDDIITGNGPGFGNLGVIDGGAGKDTITAISDLGIGNHGSGEIRGGDGDDWITVESVKTPIGNDEVLGANEGTISGGAGKDTITAKATNIAGNTGLIDGDAGDDTITASGGEDADDNAGRLDGGPDFDTCTPADEGTVRNCEA